MIAALIVLAIFLFVFFGISYVVLATPVKKDKPKKGRRMEIIRIKKRAGTLGAKN